MDRQKQEAKTNKCHGNVLAIIVLYNCSLDESTTYRHFVGEASSAAKLPVAVYDNSPTGQASSDKQSALFSYKHDPMNGGLAAAYNWGLGLALANGFSWMLLLDQDSELPGDFGQRLQHKICLIEGREDVAAIVPHVRSRGAFISPNRVKFGRLSALAGEKGGTFDYELTAINSGSAIRTSFLKALGGFNTAYRVDCLDHWLFHQVHKAGKRVAVTESIVDHDFSVHDYRHKISFVRYHSILFAEAAYVTTHKSRFEIPVYLIRLFVRMLKQVFVYRNSRIAALTAAMIMRIAAHPTRRLESEALQWHEELRGRCLT